MEQKDDFVTKRAKDVERIFGMMKQDFMATVLTISVCFNIFQGYQNSTIQKELNKQIVEEVRRQVPKAVNERVPEVVDSKLEGVRDGVDKALNKVDTIISKIGNGGKK